MYIQNLKISGFRSLANVVLRDLSPFTLFFGHNGSGKSNILAALDAIFCSKMQPPDVSGGPTSSAPFYRGLLSDFQHNYHRNTPSKISFQVTLKTSKHELKRLWPEGFETGSEIIPDSTPADRVRIELVGHIDPELDLPTYARMTLDTAKVVATLVYNGSSTERPWLPEMENLPLEEGERIGEALLTKLTGLFSNIGIARSLRREIFTNAQDQTKVDEDISASFKTRVFGVKHSQLQSDQEQFRRIQELFNKIADWGIFDFAQTGSDNKDLDVMTWDKDKLWLPVSRRGSGAEQLLVIISEVIIRQSSIIGIEELESNLDESNQEKLHELLEDLVSQPDSNVGQVIATAHSSFYGRELLPQHKFFVEIEADGKSKIGPWSSAAAKSLFKEFSYHNELKAGQEKKLREKRQQKKIREQRKPLPKK